MKLMTEAIKMQQKTKTGKKEVMIVKKDILPDKLQEAYRAGNLDLLDSINQVQ